MVKREEIRVTVDSSNPKPNAWQLERVNKVQGEMRVTTPFEDAPSVPLALSRSFHLEVKDDKKSKSEAQF